MAYTRVEIQGVPIDEVTWSWPLYRGAYAREIELRLSLSQYVKLKAALKGSKGRASITVTCSGSSGADAPKMKRTLKGVRVLELVKNNDFTCTLRMADTRSELARYIAVANLNVRWRDGLLPGTIAADMAAALKLICSRCLDLFGPNAFAAAAGVKIPDDIFTAGSAKNRGLDNLLSAAGLDLTCDWHDGLLYFTDRADIGANPTKKKHAWLLSQRPGWESEERNRYMLPQKLRYYYKRRHMRLVPLMSSRSTVVADLLTPQAEQIYFDDGFRGTVKTGYLTGEELFEKYTNGVTYDDAFIAKHIMSANFDGTPIARDGSRDFDTLHRILKRDWRRLFRLSINNAKSGWGALTEMQIGLFKNDGTKVTDELVSAGVRGDWTEFLNIVNGTGPDTILGQKIFTNHDDAPVFPTTTLLPTMPFSGTWESAEDGILRLNQQQLPDGNFAMPGLVTNHADLTIKGTNQPIQLPGGLTATSRWIYDLPTIDAAQLSVPDMYLLIVGTQRLPNDASMFKVHEVDGFAEGGVPFQEFEVPELPALYDFVDTEAPGRLDLHLHPPAGDGFGVQLNEVDTREDAESRAEVWKAEQSRTAAGQGVAAGLSGLDEIVGGPIDEITLDMRGVVITTTIKCDNLAPEAAKLERARNRAQARRPRLGAKEKQPV